MESRKVFAITILALLGNSAVAAENNNPFQAALMLTSVAPFVLTSGTLALTSAIPDLFKSSKSDALAYIGSGERSVGRSLNRHRATTVQTTLPPNV